MTEERVDAAVGACLLAGGDDASLRALASEGRAGINDHRATALLARASTARDWLVRYHAVRGLAGRADERAQAALTHALDDPEEMIRTEAARARRERT
jgi:HEAT repeat protein